MEFAPGGTAFRALEATEYGLGDRGEMLQAIGQAVAALHRVSGVGKRQFWPKPFLTRIFDRAQAVRSGQIQLPRHHKFLGLCALLHRLGRVARGQSFDAAVEHGDLHLRNILIGAETTSFIDFSNHKGIFPQRDLATIWLANCPDHLAQEGRARLWAGGKGRLGSVRKRLWGRSGE
ncbi:phosphotransferase [Pseudophaeobacter sp.]|uniref:phosphotransferase n=1 Tax=Pseudophaeobacter sp. TaxID=1971739 RepID=UPI0032983C0D